jgi:hypothetical protein
MAGRQLVFTNHVVPSPAQGSVHLLVSLLDFENDVLPAGSNSFRQLDHLIATVK